MRLVTFDLDDTLMTCGHDYSDAFDRFGEFMANRGIDTEKAIEVVNRIDHEHVDEFGLSMERFPQSFEAAYNELISDPDDGDREAARDIGYSVFKTEDEYASRGFMEGAEELLVELNDHGFDLHVITAGDPRVQNRKIRGLGLNRYFDKCHVVPIDTKADRLRELMSNHEYTPDETTLVGNSLTSDIKAALDANARGVYIPTHEWRPTENREFYETHERVHIYESLSTLSEDCPEAFMRKGTAEA